MDTMMEALEKMARRVGSGRVRRVGISKLIVSLGILLPVWLFFWLSGVEFSDWSALVAGIIIFVGAFGLVGIAEFVLGIPFAELAGRWDSLRGWQRGILGTFILMVAFVAFAVVLIWIPI